MTDIITDEQSLAWFDQFNVIDGDRLCPEMTLIFADWLEDVHELTSWAECLRWMVAEEKWPVQGFNDIWWSGDVIERNGLSGDLVRLIGNHDLYPTTTIGFDSSQAAILAVMKVWHQRDDK